MPAPRTLALALCALLAASSAPAQDSLNISRVQDLYDPTGSLLSFQAVGDTLALLTSSVEEPGTSELHLVDLSYPSPGAEIIVHRGLPEARTAHVNGSLMYLANDGGGIGVYDLLAPAGPLLLTTLRPEHVFRKLERADSLLVGWRYEGLHIFSLADPASPAERGSLAVDDIVTEMQVGDRLAVMHRYNSAEERSELDLVDFSDPAAPTHAATVAGVPRIGQYVSGWGYDVDDGLLAMNGFTNPSGDSTWFAVWDVSNPAAPQQRYIGAGFGSLHLALENDLAWVCGRVRLATGETEEGVGAVDLTDPATPVLLGMVSDPTAGNARRLAWSGSRLAFYALRTGVRIVETSDLEAMPTLGSYDRWVEVEGAWVVGDMLAVAERDEGIAFSRIVDPYHPEPLGRLEVAGKVWWVGEGPQNALAALIEHDWPAGRLWMHALDVGAGTPALMDSLELPLSALPVVERQGSVAWIPLDGQQPLAGESLLSLDISDPFALAATDTLIELEDFTTKGLTAHGDHLYWITQTLLRVLDISDPLEPAMILERAQLHSEVQHWETTGGLLHGVQTTLNSLELYRYDTAALPDSLPPDTLHYDTPTPPANPMSYSFREDTLVAASIFNGLELFAFDGFDSLIATGYHRGVGPEVVVNGHAFYALSPQNVTVLVEGELPEDDNGVREDAPLARGFELAAPWPNPFNSSVALRYRLDRPGRAVLTVHDLLGRRVATLAQGAHGAGRHEARWDGRSGEGSPVASGSYIVRLATDRGGRAVRVVLLR